MEADVEFMEQMLALLVQLKPGHSLHFEPFETEWRVRISNGRQMIEQELLSHQQGIQIGEFLLKGADIFERAMKLPANGLLKLAVDDRERYLQVYSTPVVWGVKLVVKPMQTSLPLFSLSSLGFEPSVLKLLQDVTRKPNGLVILGGRSRSGRSTTGRAILAAAVAAGRRVISIDYADQGKISGVEHLTIDPDLGQNASGLMRSLKDSPVEVVKTYLDGNDEMAESLHAAPTRLVIGDMNVGDALGGIFRFLVNGHSPVDLARSLSLILFQKLVPRLCPSCRVSKPASTAMLKSLGIDDAFLHACGGTGTVPPAFWQAHGCATCDNKGYNGLQPVTEALPATEEIRKLVLLPDAPREDWEAAAARAGWVPVRRQALAYALRGLIRVEDAVMQK